MAAPAERLFDDFLVVGLTKLSGGGVTHKLLYHLQKGAPEADAITEVRFIHTHGDLRVCSLFARC